MIWCRSDCWLFRRAIRDDDDEHTVFLKKMVIVAGIVMTVLYVYTLYRSITKSLAASLFPVSALLGIAIAMTDILVNRRLNHLVLEVSLYLFSVSLLLYDWIADMTLSFPMWPNFVLVLDVVLVTGLPPRVAYNLIAMVTLWVILTSSEQAYRWGLFDVSIIPQAERLAVCDCASPPCPLGLQNGMSYFIASTTVFFLDYYFTRGFAYGLREEKQSMQNVIKAAEWIAHCLSRFDLDSAETAITTSPLPPPLHDAFTNILQNLHSYKPYLPQSCLQHNNEESVDNGSDRDDVFFTPEEGSGSGEPEHRDSGTCLGGRQSSVEDHTRRTEKKMISYTVSNLLGSHEFIDGNAEAYTSRFTSYITAVVGTVSAHKGVVGVVVGDHVHASFNAVKRCAGHARNSVEAALELRTTLQSQGISVVTGVSSGEAHCGPLGSKDLMAFCAIGKGVVTASAMERFGTWHGHAVVCSGSVYKEVSCIFPMKLVVADIRVRGGGEEQVLSYEVLVHGTVAEGMLNGPDEWMYELEVNVWEVFNNAGRALLMGRVDEAERLLGVKGGEKPADVAAAEEWLMGAVRGGGGVEVLSV